MRCSPSRRRPSIFSPAAGLDTEIVNGRPSFVPAAKIGEIVGITMPGAGQRLTNKD